MRTASKSVARAVKRAMVATRTEGGIYWLSSHVPAEWLWSHLRPDIHMYTMPESRRIERHGVWLDVDLSDYVQWLIFHDVEASLRRRLYELVQPGDVAIDVGSNIGDILLGLAKSVGSEGRAIGFEANPATHLRCQRNLDLNPFSWAEVQPIGLGDTDAELSFGRRTATNSGADAFMRAGDGTLSVRVARLDRIAENLGLQRIDLIKIDVEGYETNVLRGAECVIRSHKPAMFIEVCDDNLISQGSSAAELIGLLEEHGYSIAKADTGETVLPDQDFRGCFFDVICRPRG